MRALVRRSTVLPLASSLVTAMALAGCGGGAEAGTSGGATGAQITVEHAQGTTAVPADPETVVVFDIGALATLDSIGVDAAGVPDASFPEALARYGADDVAKVGSLFEPDYEAVNALEPDLVVVAGRSAAAYPELAEIAPTVDLTVDNRDFFASFRERATALAEVFGAEDEVADRLAALDQRIAEVSEAAADAGDALFVMTNASELSAYGPETRFGFVYDELGLTAADRDLSNADHGDAISFEYLAETDPDLLFVLDRDAAIGEEAEAAEQVLDNELVHGTTAWQNDDVHYVDPTTWYVAPNGLPSVETMVEEVATAVE